MTPEQRRRHAQRSARARWRNAPDRRYKSLHQIGTAILSAHTGLSAILSQLQSTQRVELEHWLHRLITAVANLWEVSGADLPKQEQDILAALLHELQDQAREEHAGGPSG
jgi:hypothetical protein